MIGQFMHLRTYTQDMVTKKCAFLMYCLVNSQIQICRRVLRNTIAQVHVSNVAHGPVLGGGGLFFCVCLWLGFFIYVQCQRLMFIKRLNNYVNFLCGQLKYTMLTQARQKQHQMGDFFQLYFFCIVENIFLPNTMFCA